MHRLHDDTHVSQPLRHVFWQVNGSLRDNPPNLSHYNR